MADRGEILEATARVRLVREGVTKKVRTVTTKTCSLISDCVICVLGVYIYIFASHLVSV